MSGRNQARRQGAREIYVGLRAAIVTMRVFYQEKYEDIERKIGVKASTSRNIFVGIRNRAGNDDFHELMANLELARPIGRSPKVVNGTPESAAIRDLLMEHPEQKFEEVGENFGIPLARSTIEKIAHEHRDPVHHYAIKRRIAQYKPPLDDDLKEWRLEYAQWALAELNNGAIFIFSDETYPSFGGHPYKKQRVTMGEGQPAEYAALHSEKPQFFWMEWAAIVFDIEFEMPLVIWDKETIPERDESQQTLNAENVRMQEEVAAKCQRALQPGTQEYRELEEINANIRRFNAERRAQGHTGQAGFKKQKKPEQVWKYEPLTRSTQLKGIDWFLYRERILLPLLYPLCEAVMRKYPDRAVYLVEDNAGLHAKAAWVCEMDRQRRGIKKAPHPPNSPDLNQIEPLWDYQHTVMDRYEVQGSSQEEIDRMKDLCREEWRKATKNGKATQCCNGFRDKLELCIAAGGDNNYRG